MGPRARLHAGTLALLALAACREAEPPPVPTPGVDVRRYDLALRFDPATFEAAGRAHLTVLHPGASGPLALGLDDAMTVTAVRVDGRPVRFERADDGLFVPLGREDSSRVEVAYRGRVEEGIYRGEAAGQTVVYAESWPARGAGWLPAVHHPSDPARFTLHLEVPARYDVVASGTAAGVTGAGGWRRHAFRLDADAPVYTFAFAIADSFAVVTDSAASVPVRHALLEPEKAPLLARTGLVLDTLAVLLGPYPYAAYTTVQVPMTFAGMENAAAPFLDADLYRAGGSLNAVEAVNVHEAVHQWFGNDVVPADWRDLWLAEGFATYLTTVVYERLGGEAEAMRRRLQMARLPVHDARRPLVPERYSAPEDLLTPTVYQKGSSVLHLLRLTLGDAAFFRALRRLTAEYAERPLSTDVLRGVLESESGADLTPFFRYWVYGERIPTLHTTWDASARRLAWRVEGDAGTLEGVPFALLVRQAGREVFVKATEGGVTLPNAEPPEVFPVGILLDVE
jgi:aminopeptidase N